MEGASPGHGMNRRGGLGRAPGSRNLAPGRVPTGAPGALHRAPGRVPAGARQTLGALPDGTSLLLLAFLLAACEGPYPPPPDTRVETVVDVIHGVEVADDYRWLESQDAPETRAWIAAQNAHAEAVIGEAPHRERIRDRLRELLDVPDVGTPRAAGDFEYFTMRRAGEEAPVVYRRPRRAEDDEPAPSVEESYDVVLDPADLDPTYRTLLGIVGFSRDGSLLMYTVRRGGADEVEVRIRDLAAGTDLSDRLPTALHAGLRFDADGRGFHYVHRSRETGPRLRHHVLGTPVAEDEEVWGEGIGPTAFLSMNEVADGRYRIYGVQHGWARNDVHFEDRRDGRGSGRSSSAPMPTCRPASGTGGCGSSPTSTPRCTAS